MSESSKSIVNTITKNLHFYVEITQNINKLELEFYEKNKFDRLAWF